MVFIRFDSWDVCFELKIIEPIDTSCYLFVHTIRKNPQSTFFSSHILAPLKSLSFCKQRKIFAIDFTEYILQFFSPISPFLTVPLRCDVSFVRLHYSNTNVCSSPKCHKIYVYLLLEDLDWSSNRKAKRFISVLYAFVVTLSLCYWLPDYRKEINGKNSRKYDSTKNSILVDPFDISIHSETAQITHRFSHVLLTLKCITCNAFIWSGQHL